MTKPSHWKMAITKFWHQPMQAEGLALMRILLGLALLADQLLQILPNLEEFFGPTGVPMVLNVADGSAFLASSTTPSGVVPSTGLASAAPQPIPAPAGSALLNVTETPTSNVMSSQTRLSVWAKASLALLASPKIMSRYSTARSCFRPWRIRRLRSIN